MTTAPTPTNTVDRALREAPYVLMKRGLYWRPNGQGYTGVLAEAGRYSETDARAHHDHDADSTTMHLASECFDFAPACWPETQIAVREATIAAQRAEIERLETSLNDALEKAYHWQKQFETLDSDCASLAANQCEGPMAGDERGHFSCAKVDALASELGRVKAALKPFCFGDPTIERILYDGMPDDAPGTFTIKLGDIRAARAALQEPSP